jgi:hypothetical protein
MKKPRPTSEAESGRGGAVITNLSFAIRLFVLDYYRSRMRP